jgi:hypothetical protein
VALSSSSTIGAGTNWRISASIVAFWRLLVSRFWNLGVAVPSA